MKVTTIEPSNIIREKKKRVAAYCRVSTDAEEQLQSLETQKSHYENYINTNPDWKFAGLYYDEGISGTKAETRPALMQMIRDCEDGKIDFIVTKSLSRFSRNTTDCLELVRKLLGLGIPIYFEKENINTASMDSELILSIMSSIAESESISISENTKWGMQHRFKNGTFKASYVPYGYTVKDGVFYINEDEAGWVRFIFKAALRGMGTTAIAKELTERNVPSRRGKKWNSTTIREILKNEKYIGDCLLQKTYMDFRFKRHTNHGEMDMYYIEGHHEPIVTKEEFEKAGAIIEQHAKEKNIQKNSDVYQRRYPFTKKIVCGNCGSSFKRKVCYTGSINYAVWSCSQHIDDISKCDVKAIREDVLENTFMTLMNKLIFARREILENLLAEIRNEENRADLIRIAEIDRKLEKNTEKRQTLTEISAKGYLDPALFTKENNDTITESEKLKEEKNVLLNAINKSKGEEKALKELIKFAAESEMLTEFDRSVADRFLEKITVHSQNEVTFRLKCGLEIKERTEI